VPPYRGCSPARLTRGGACSADNAFLLTSSEDGTVRLWNNAIKSNLVVYKVARVRARVPGR
jgi:hypothetical protein